MAKPMHPDVLIDVLKAEGLAVVKYRGWDRRCRCCPDSGPHRPDGPWNMPGRGWGDVNGTVVHITAGNLGNRTVEDYIANIINGDPDVPVKAQFVVAPNGTVFVNSTGRANHVGKVGSNVRDHLKAADFALNDPYDDRFRGGSVDGNAFTYGIENIAASKMTDEQREASVRICAAIARHYDWTGQESVGHGEISSARYPADPNLDMGKFRRDVMARVGSVSPSPEPEPKPEPVEGPQVVSVSQNMAGNNATGIRTAAKRIARYVAARKASPVDVINAQETTVASTVRPRLDSGLGPLGYKRTNGGKGRYQYPRNSVKVIAHGLITTPSSTWYRGDDKQASWVVYEKAGVRAMDVSLHLESESGATADRLRVLQAKYIAAQALGIATANKVDHRNVLLTGDTNSEGMVVSALEDAGWRNCAAGTPFENTHTFMGWDGRSRKRFDYALVRKDAAEAKVVAVSHDTNISDHAGLRIVRTLTA